MMLSRSKSVTIPSCQQIGVGPARQLRQATARRPHSYMVYHTYTFDVRSSISHLSDYFDDEWLALLRVFHPLNAVESTSLITPT